MRSELYIIPATSIAGFIDAIAGGGGLITLPMWSMVVGAGPVAVATNKVGALMGASSALWVYQRKHPLPWREGLWFLAAVMAGAGAGSQLTGFLPPKAFAVVLLCLCPVVLWMVWSRERLFAERPAGTAPAHRFALAGFLVGVYDGFFGPGGGTFMLLALLGLTQMPLMSALALSKLANALSAAAGLTGFALQGHVRWGPGLIGGAAMACGALLGARFTSRDAVKAVKPALTLVVAMLMAKILWDSLQG